MKLNIQSLTCGYETGVVLESLSLSVKNGEFLSLLGPSGCGKTTLMKTIAGIVPAQSGSIFLDGQDITRLPIHKRGTVVLFQDMRLFPHKTALENVAFPLKMQGIPKQERLKTAAQLLKRVQMEAYANRKPGALSGGQQQRIALARALAAKPKLLLLDEPFSALDENLREEMRSLVLQLQREFAMTVILVTHDRQEALSMSDRVALLFEGKLLQTGTPQEVYTRPVSPQAADYFGNCIYLPGQISKGQFLRNTLRIPAALPDGPCRLLLRPDALELEHPGDYWVRVEAISFRGSETLVSFRSKDGTLWKKPFSGPISWSVGQEIRCNLNLTWGILFPGQTD